MLCFLLGLVCDCLFRICQKCSSDYVNGMLLCSYGFLYVLLVRLCSVCTICSTLSVRMCSIDVKRRVFISCVYCVRVMS